MQFKSLLQFTTTNRIKSITTARSFTMEAKLQGQLTPKSRFNLYKVIHKYARDQISMLTRSAGNFDFNDMEERNNLLKQFNSLFKFLDDHAKREETYIHPLLKEINSKNLEVTEKTHKELECEIDTLRVNLDQAKIASDFYKFYLDFSKFQAQYFLHLHDEESVLMPELNLHFTDERLLKENGVMMKNMSKEYMLEVTAGMLPAINHHERVLIFAEMKQSMPPDLFKTMCELAEKSLDKNQVSKLFSAIGVGTDFLSEQRGDNSEVHFSHSPISQPTEDNKRGQKRVIEEKEGEETNKPLVTQNYN